MNEFTDTPQDAFLAENDAIPTTSTTDYDDRDDYEDEDIDQMLDYVSKKFNLDFDEFIESNPILRAFEKQCQEEANLSEEERNQLEAQQRFDYECHTRHTQTISDFGMPSPNMAELQILAETREPVPCRLDLDPATVTTAGGDYLSTTAQVALVSENESPIHFVRLLAQPEGAESVARNIPLGWLSPAEQRCMTHRFNAGYPECDGAAVSFKLLEIREWEEGLEATLVGEVIQRNEYLHRIAFYDTRYAIHKQQYRIGEIYTFSLSALSYYTFRHTDFYEASLFKNVFSSQQTIGLPQKLLHFYAENSDFEGLVEEIKPFQWKEYTFYCLGLDLFAGCWNEKRPHVKQHIPLYVREEYLCDLCPAELTQGFAINGTLWLQGHLIEEETAN